MVDGQTKLIRHIGDLDDDGHDTTGGGGGTDDQTATEVPFTPTGTIAATDTQAAVAEVATDAASALASHVTAGHTLDFGEVGDIAASAFGDTAAAGATGEVADAGHRHAREADPITAHLAAGDPHPTYLTAAEGAAAFDAAGAATSAVSTHAGLSDPHPGYLTTAEGDAAYRAIGYVPTHAATTGQTANDHHAQLHAAAHATGQPDALTAAGIGAAAASHAHAEADVTSLVTDLAGKSATSHTHTHAATTGQTTDDHHAKSHVHSADGSGTVAHASLSGISATDHHAAPAAGPDADAVIDGAGAAGTASTFARSQHGHQVVTSSALPLALGAAAAGAAGAIARSQHVHPTTGLSLTGHGPADHADVTRKLWLPGANAKLDTATAANIGASPDLTGVVAYADAATQGAFWSFMVPADWASGVITIQPVWSPGSTDATSHTVRWSLVAKAIAAGSTVTAAGTTVLFTGASAARTVGVVVYDTATSTTLTPAAAGDWFRLALRRIGADAADTYVGVVNLIGVIVSYTANQ